MEYEPLEPCEFKRIRQKLGFKSPTEFAKALGLSHKTIYDYENGSIVIKKPMTILMKFLDTTSKRKLQEFGLRK